MLHPGTEEANVLSSITSTRIQKVTLLHEYSLWDFPSYDIEWEVFDESLCRLADQSECGWGLEVDFRFMNAGYVGSGEETEAIEIVNSLTKFKEKGRTRVICVGPDDDERVVYSSGGVT